MLEGHSCILSTNTTVWFPLKGAWIVWSETALPCEGWGSQENVSKAHSLPKYNMTVAALEGLSKQSRRKVEHPHLVFPESIW